MNVTEKQFQALKEIDAGLISQRLFGSGAWRILGPSHPSVVGKVVSMKLARWLPVEGDTQKITLTDLGRQQLKPLTQ